MMSTSRRALTGASLLAIAGLLAGCASDTEGPSEGSSGTEEATITFVAYGGVGQDLMIEVYQDPYTAENPEISFLNTSPPDLAQVQAQVENDVVEWDVLATSPAAAQQNCGTLFEPLDFSGVDDSNLVEGTIGECYIGNFLNATPLAYRTDAFPNGGPENIEDFFDVEAFPGQRGVITNLHNGILEYGLLGDGVPADDLYPLDVDRSLAKWDEIRDVTTFAPNVGALQQAVADSQVDVFLLSDSRLVPTMRDGLDITIVWDVTVASVNAFAVPLGAPSKDAAEDFLATVVEPEQAGGIAEALGVAPVNLSAELDLDEFASRVAVFGDANTGETVVQNIDWYADNFNEVTTALTNWLAG